MVWIICLIALCAFIGGITGGFVACVAYIVSAEQRASIAASIAVAEIIDYYKELTKERTCEH